ncbi:MAG TPA: hypothetical protein VGD37_22290 [Kofleriaceae bacterium]
MTGPRTSRGRRRAGALAWAVWLGAAACGGPQRPATGDGAAAATEQHPAAPAPPPAHDARTPIEQRRDAACQQLGPRITACAVEDARARLAAGKIDQRQFDADTAAAVQRKHTEEFDKACKGASYSSRQIRVLEVCFHEETRCAPLLDCLGHLSDRPPAPGGK